MSMVEILRSSLDLQRPDNWLSCPLGGAFEASDAFKRTEPSFSSAHVLLFSSDPTPVDSF